MGDEMKKSDLALLSDTKLLRLLTDMESTIVKQANFRNGGITDKTVKEYKWVVGECILRFNLNEHDMKKEFAWLFVKNKF